MKEILLCNACIRAEILRGFVREPLRHDPLHPDIHGKSFQPVEAIEQGAFRHFWAYTVNEHQGFSSLFYLHFGNGLQIHLPFRHQTGSGQQVFGPESGAQRGQFFQRRSGKALGRGEMEQPFFGRLSEGFTEPLDDSFDTGDVIVLRNNKGTQRLPGLLSKNADSARVSRGFCKYRVQLAQFLSNGRVIGVNVKITAPQGFIFFRRTGEKQLLSVFLQRQFRPNAIPCQMSPFFSQRKLCPQSSV